MTEAGRSADSSSRIIQVAIAVGLLLVLTAGAAVAQRPMVRPNPLQDDSTCMKWKQTLPRDMARRSGAVPPDSVGDRRYRECAVRNSTSVQQHDSLMTHPDSATLPGPKARRP